MNTRARRKAPQRSIALWLSLFVLCICAAVTAGGVWLEGAARDAAVSMAQERQRSLATSLAQHADDTFEIADLTLTAAQRLVAEDRHGLDEPARLSSIFAVLAAQTPRVRAVHLLGEEGRMRATSLPAVLDDGFDARQDYFLHHARTPGTGTFLGKPILDRDTNEWVLTASRRIDGADGRFAGVLLVTVDVGYFVGFHATFGRKDDLGITMLSSDGLVLSRFPSVRVRPGTSYAQMPWFEKVDKTARAGILHFVSPISSNRRIAGYGKLRHYPALVFVHVSEDAVLEPWRRELRLHVPVIAFVVLVVGAGGFWLVRQAERRRQREARYEHLAATDGLTGLYNRRTFDEMLHREWGRLRAGEGPLSVLIIDVDHFKSFNDRYGHQAGDTCLQAVALTLRASVHVAEDRVARYGGEEFAAILPDTPRDQALLVAERMRCAIERLAIMHEGRPGPQAVTVSIGCSTALRREAEDLETPGPIVSDADRALYRAKLAGRNRVATSDDLTLLVA